jgi:site-specific recombinase XerD
MCNLVFHSQTQTPLDPDNLRRAFRIAIGKANIVDLHFHDLRHTFATRLVQAGVDLYKVQRLLGHKSPIMTQRYAHHYPESLRDGVEKLDAGRVISTLLAQPSEMPSGVCVSV